MIARALQSSIKTRRKKNQLQKCIKGYCNIFVCNTCFLQFVLCINGQVSFTCVYRLNNMHQTLYRWNTEEMNHFKNFHVGWKYYRCIKPSFMFGSLWICLEFVMNWKIFYWSNGSGFYLFFYILGLINPNL